MGRSKRPRAGPSTASPPPLHLPDGNPIAAGTGRGTEYRPIPPGSPEARRLFAYAAASVPPPSPREMGWGAWVKAEAPGENGATDERLVGALLVERSGTTGMIHGPVVVESEEPLEVAARLLAAALPHVTAQRVETLFARPQGLDRVWVRFGFIPVPEADLPPPLKGRPGSGLYAWRGGSALWSARKLNTSDPDDQR